MADLAKQRKLVMPFFDRAEECEMVAPLAAYWTRQAGIIKGLGLKPLHPELKDDLLAMMGRLEADKVELSIGKSDNPELVREQKEQLRAFALRVFGVADRTDQLGARDNKLVTKYMAARTFLHAIEAVEDGQLSQKEAELLKYCEVRVFQIRKAQRSGIEIPPPPAKAADEPSAAEELDLERELTAIDDAATAAAATTSGGGGFGDLPTVPSTMHGGVAAGPQLPVIFTRGAHILFKKDARCCPQEGRILTTSGANATISTETATVEADASQLAPYLPSGSEVMLRLPNDPSGLSIAATIIRDDADSVWPPNFTVRLSDARTLQVPHSVFTVVSVPPGLRKARPAPVSPIAPPEDGLPSVPAVLPGVPQQNFGLASPDVIPPRASSGYPPFDAPPSASPHNYPHQPNSSSPPPAPTWTPAPPPPPPQPSAPPAVPPPSRSPANGSFQTGPVLAKAQPSHEDKEGAKKLAKQAISALNFDDIQSACDALSKALARLAQ